MIINDEQGNPWHNLEARIRRLNMGVNINRAGAYTSFHCETCWMQDLEDCDIEKGDDSYQIFFHRANFNAIAGKAKSTIDSHRHELLSTIKDWEDTFFTT